jgi:hypothetical protein
MAGAMRAEAGRPLRYRSFEVSLGGAAQAWLYAAVGITLSSIFLSSPSHDSVVVVMVTVAVLSSIRSFQIGIVVNEDTIRITNFWQTVTIRWNEVRAVSLGKQFSWGAGRGFSCISFTVLPSQRIVMVTATLAGAKKRQALIAFLKCQADRTAIPFEVDLNRLARHIW